MDYPPGQAIPGPLQGLQGFRGIHDRLPTAFGLRLDILGAVLGGIVITGLLIGAIVDI
jgi:hypothetical protein